MAYIPPFESGPLSDGPDEIETLLEETIEFLEAKDEQVATDVALHRRDQLERRNFNASMRAHLAGVPTSNRVDELRADKNSLFADELLLSMSVEHRRLSEGSAKSGRARLD
ncbi:MAG TPA: hypothetical protein VFI84_01755 [Candidatus Saccharimonadales bacterium]|nr:hypothetical protein [Candidatus Saccharimonadales bacterium]